MKPPEEEQVIQSPQGLFCDAANLRKLYNKRQLLAWTIPAT